MLGLAVQRVASSPGRFGEIPGFALFVARETVGDAVLLPALPDAHVVVGRHTHCDVEMPLDPTVSLRHVLVRCVRASDGSPAIRALDLMTSQALALDDGTRAESLVASGPVAIGVAGYALLAVPTGPGARGVLGDGPYRQPEPPVVMRAARLARHQPLALGAERSHITLLPGVLEAPNGGVAAAPTRRITLQRGQRRANASLSEAQLERGLLLGRADKCFRGGARDLFGPHSSRAHALLLREDGEDRLYNLASTQGVYVGERRVRMLPLPREGATVRLGFAEPVWLEVGPRLDG